MSTATMLAPASFEIDLLPAARLAAAASRGAAFAAGAAAWAAAAWLLLALPGFAG